jgi:Ca-activated chloride channel family protein
VARHNEGNETYGGGRRRGRGLVLVLVLALAATAVLLWRRGDAASSDLATPPVDTTPTAEDAASRVPIEEDSFPPTPGQGPCIDVDVLTSLENADLVTALASAYQGDRRNIDGRCVNVNVTPERSGVALDVVRRGFEGIDTTQAPTIWAPDSTAWLSLARRQQGERPILPDSVDRIAYSPIVIAMPAPQAELLGWTTNPPTWADYLRTSRQPDVWNSRGKPEWGEFKLGKTSPQMATSGLYGLAAAYQATAGGELGSLDRSQVDSPTVADAVHASEIATVHYGSVEAHFLWHARQAEDSGTVTNFLSAVTLQERSVYDYNRGVVSQDGITETVAAPPHNQLVPIYPTEGTFMADHPMAILNAPWVDFDKRAAANDFVRYARSAQGQQLARISGYRDLNLEADPPAAEIGRYGPTTAIHPVQPPTADVLAAVQDSFIQVRKRARVLFAVDVSGSMVAKLPDGRSRLEAAQQAIAKSLRYFDDEDDVGLAGFSNRGSSTQLEPGVVVPVTPIGPKRDAFVAAVNQLVPLDQTPLYDAVTAFLTDMRREFNPQEINAVVVLSDGRNDTTLTGTLETLRQHLGEHHQHQPVRVFTLAYGVDADKPALQAIARDTGAHFYDASDVSKIDAVLSDLVTNF